jgi:hypothetical protein
LREERGKKWKDDKEKEVPICLGASLIHLKTCSKVNNSQGITETIESGLKGNIVKINVQSSKLCEIEFKPCK